MLVASFRSQLISFETLYHGVVSSILLPKYNIKKYYKITKKYRFNHFLWYNIEL